MFSFIDIRHLFNDYRKSIGKYYSHLHIWLPMVLAMLSLFLFRYNITDVIQTGTSFLTSFVPIFATILTVYVSWAFSENKSRHSADRNQLIKETVTAIILLIPLDLLALFFILLLNVRIFDGNCVEFEDMADKCMSISCLPVGCIIRWVFRYCFLVILYSMVVTILVITKRSYIIIKKELDNLIS